MSPARIGPNAIIQTAAALEALAGADVCARVFRSAGLAPYLAHMPEHMVAEREIEALLGVLETDLGPETARRVAAESGRRTGDYILENRIPGPARRLLRLLPPMLASRLLLRAIRAHAWTFVGSGRFRFQTGNPTLLRIDEAPVCIAAPVAGRTYYVATFARLFEVLVSPQCRTVLVPGAENAGGTCIFALDW